jgi:hypothetical protein
MLIEQLLYIIGYLRIAGATLESAFIVGRASGESACQDKSRGQSTKLSYLTAHFQDPL